MNKKKIIFINFLIFLLLLIISEIFSFHYLKTKYNNDIFRYSKIQNPTNEKYNWLRPVEYRDNSKAPILLFGCSYAYGFELEEDKTFSRKLADYTNRTVVNRAFQAEGPAFMYKQLEDPHVVAEIKEKLAHIEPTVILYVFISGHPMRTFKYRCFQGAEYFNDRYTIDKNNKLKKNQPNNILSIFHSLYTVILIEKIKENIDLKNKDKVNKTNTLLFSESYKKAKKYFPNAKFVIIGYPDGIDDNNISENFKQLQDNLNKEIPNNNIFFIDIYKIFPDIFNRQYWLANDPVHPSAEAWEKLTPIIADKLDLK